MGDGSLAASSSVRAASNLNRTNTDGSGVSSWYPSATSCEERLVTQRGQCGVPFIPSYTRPLSQSCFSTHHPVSM